MEPRQGMTVEELLRRITPRAWVTPTITVVLVACFALSAIFGASPLNPTAQQLLDVGADFGPFVVNGQWWRLITATLLHAGLVHLAFNLWAFWNAGQFAERIFGNLAFLAIYWLSAVGGELASLGWNPMGVGVGASGAVFGVYGALLAFVMLHRGVLPTEYLAAQRNSLFAFIGYNVVFSFMQSNINLAAHAGGLATGFCAGAVLGRDLLDPRADSVGRLLRGVGVVALLGLGGWAVHNRIAAVPAVRADRLAQQAYGLLATKQYPEAIKLYSRALDLQEDANWYFNRGLARLDVRDGVNGIADLHAAHRLDPTELSQALLCEKSVEWARADEFAAAEKECDAALGGRQSSADLLASRGIARAAQGNAKGALADAEAALKLAPDHVSALSIRAGLLMDSEHFEEAARDCRVLTARSPPRAYDLHLCANLAHLQHDDARAVALLDQAIQSGATVSLLRARAVLHRENQRVAEALADLDRALVLEPGNTEVLIDRAFLERSAGRDSDALATYDRALKADPDNPRALNNRAWLKVGQGDFAGARADADRAVALRPESSAYLGTRCFALAGLKDVESARRDCARSNQLDPKEPFTAGMLAVLEGRPADARREWETALAQAPWERSAVAPWLAQLPRR